VSRCTTRRLRFVRDTFETKGVLGGRIVTSRRSLRLTFSQLRLLELPVSQPTAIRCQGCEALIDSGIVSSWTVVTTDGRRESRIVRAYIYPYKLWWGIRTSIGVDEMWKSLGRTHGLGSGLAGSTELDSAVLVVLGPSQPFRFA